MKLGRRGTGGYPSIMLGRLYERSIKQESLGKV